MTNIWGFFLHTTYVSFVALLFLLVKKILEDKLSPNWQYGVWVLFGVSILLPVRMTHYVIVPIGLWFETLKYRVELGLDSVYTNVYEAFQVKHSIPIITEAPKSITDWLFVIYVIGIVCSLLWYLISYLRLRVLLRPGKPVSEEMQIKIHQVAMKYHLKECKCVAIKGLQSAFVCGVCSPILVIPFGVDLDEKIILHELLHLKHKDARKSMEWCILRSFHWCNPFLQIVFSRIANDMESLCDQRVLELLEGEERRQYGVVLLSMANEKYPRLAGTSSISNGGKNISRRIQAIVRFKQYPKGMALVSYCIIILLGCTVMQGQKSVYANDKFWPKNEKTLEESMAMTRLNRCTIIAGALDTYAKAVMLDNGIYKATVSSLKQQEALLKQMQQNPLDGEEIYYWNWEVYAKRDTEDKENGTKKNSDWNITNSEREFLNVEYEVSIDKTEKNDVEHEDIEKGYTEEEILDLENQDNYNGIKEDIVENPNKTDMRFMQEYRIFDLQKQADGVYEAYLGFALYEGEYKYFVEQFSLEELQSLILYTKDTIYSKETIFEYNSNYIISKVEEEDTSGDSMIIPVKVFYENGWIVEECGKRILYEQSLDELRYRGINGDLLQENLMVTGETGIVTIACYSVYEIDNRILSENHLFPSFNWGSFDETPKLDAEFDNVSYGISYKYECTPNTLGKLPERDVKIVIDELGGLTDKGTPLDERTEEILEENMEQYGNVSMGDNQGHYVIMREIDENWTGTLTGGGGSGYSGADVDIVEYPKAYKVSIFWDDRVVEELILNTTELRK